MISKSRSSSFVSISHKNLMFALVWKPSLRKTPQTILLIFNKPSKFLSLVLVMMLLPRLVKQSTSFLRRDNTILSWFCSVEPTRETANLFLIQNKKFQSKYAWVIRLVPFPFQNSLYFAHFVEVEKIRPLILLSLKRYPNLLNFTNHST